MNDPLAEFLDGMDRVVAAESSPRALATGGAKLLAQCLLARPESLPPRFRRPRPDRYNQHIVHVHPQGKYSLVSLVWLPGQRTEIHDHRCWCVVGVLHGGEREIRYRLQREGSEESLVYRGETLNGPGRVSRLVPPEENIHQVENAGDGVAISLHVYGADISALGTSINRTFALPIRYAERPTQIVGAAWRDGDHV